MSDEVDAAVEAADIRALLMVLFHLTGDSRWLSDPFTPHRDVRLIGDTTAGLTEQAQHQVRAAVLDLIQQGLTEPAVSDPGEERFGQMIDHYLGEHVPPEYVPMVRQDMGFEPRDAAWPTAPAPGMDVIIVGAGVFGICLAIKLEALGIRYTIIERQHDIGGTWLLNRYPGCGVDTPNHFYSYSFAPNPGWTRFFSSQPELQAYVANVADGAGVRDRIHFSTEMTAAKWDDDRGRWVVEITDSDGVGTIDAAVLVCATGHFNEPTPVRFPGDETFQGEVVHSTRWPDDLDLTGKRVGVIGTGATSMQLVPSIAPEVETLTVLQRSPQWVRPVAEYRASVDPATTWLFEHLPFYGIWYRFGQFWRYGDGLLRFLRKDPDWPHPDRALNRINDRHRQEMTDYLHEQLADQPELVEKCLPTYPAFGKRILLDNGWFETITQPHVQLVTDAITSWEESGIRTDDGVLHEFDVIILATGFTVTNHAARFAIEGRDGTTLAEDWADQNPRANVGMTVPGFPNLFVMYGPNTNLGHGGSGMNLAEMQTRYIMACMAAMAERDATTLEVHEAQRAAYTEWVDELHEDLIWTHPGMTTYYRNPKGKVRSPMPFRLLDYWQLTSQVDPDHYIFSGGNRP